MVKYEVDDVFDVAMASFCLLFSFLNSIARLNETPYKVR